MCCVQQMGLISNTQTCLKPAEDISNKDANKCYIYICNQLDFWKHKGTFFICVLRNTLTSVQGPHMNADMLT